MATPSLKATIDLNIRRFKSFLGFTAAFLRKKNPIKKFFIDMANSMKDLMSMKKKIKMIENRIYYEKYKLKKTEMILAQNTDHYFLKRGNTIDKLR